MTFNYGWVCPKCGRCYSPIVTMCAYCGPIHSSTTSNMPDVSNSDPWHLTTTGDSVPVSTYTTVVTCDTTQTIN